MNNKNIILFQKAISLIKSANLKDAYILLNTILRKEPNQAQVLRLLGQINFDQQKFTEAINYFLKYIKVVNTDAKIFQYLAEAYYQIEKFPDCLEAYKKALRLDLNNVELYKRISLMMIRNHQHLVAEQYLNEAIKINPNDDELIFHIGNTKAGIGEAELAHQYYEKAFNMDSSKKELLSSMSFNLHRLNDKTQADLFALAQKYYDLHLKNIPQKSNYDHSSKLVTGKEKLKIGFVSADFCKHPVTTYLIPVFQRIDKSKFEIYLYYNNSPIDDYTKELQKHIKKLQIIKDVNSHEVADSIYEDGIDVLFDMSGFTGGERLEVFKLKPAPVQITHLGYFGTVGMPEMDFIIADNVLVPEGDEKFFTESVYRFPGSYTHCGLYDMPEPSQQLPYNKNGYITFGAVNHYHKVTDSTLQAWSQILKQVPNSKILFDMKALGSSLTQDHLTKRLREHDIDLDRVILQNTYLRPDFLKTYHEIDLCLDTFPYGGGTTTIEGLLMNVPVLSLYGWNWVGRQSSSILKAIGHAELIAENIQDYINRAVELSVDISRLAEYRQTLRRDMQNSGMNPDLYIHNFEKAILEMWNFKKVQKFESCKVLH